MDIQIPEPQKASIHKLYNKSQAHEQVLAELAVMERFRDTTDIDRVRSKIIKKGFNYGIDDIVKVFKDMEAAGLGKTKLGNRSGNNPEHHRFARKYNCIAVGREALASNAVPVKIKPTMSTNATGRMVFMHHTPTGERVKLTFNSTGEVRELISHLQEMLA